MRADLASGLLLEKTLLACLGPIVEPIDEEVRAFYEAHIEDYLTEEEVKASHLFKKVEKVEERQQLFDALREVRRQARAGGDFDALALAHTDKEDKLVDLGWFKQGDFMDEFGAIAFSLEEGEVSPVFSSYFGFHLAKCTGRRPPERKPFDDVKDDVRARLMTETRQAQSRELVAALTAAARIEEREDAAEEAAPLAAAH